ncbi:FAD:protein FMN transferase [Cryobacterium tagatosivorans]|uniref:FAD:protein FMN transferase n=2 Tax=Cryobacterium tagatosivorans TaxID=1259199 RepID=A0A4R8UHN6_9MICO|nr:FAD:protein FMN transferase [Cryobacterium tagatosivorans]
MGTVVSLRMGDGDAHDGTGTRELRRMAGAAAEAAFRRWDERFSLYRRDSELSRVARGDIRLTEASATLRDCYMLALGWRDRTDGVFTPHRADGVVDLSGVVKGLAIAETGEILAGLGLAGWSINAGGDILVDGRPAPEVDWVVGIVDPMDRGEVLAGVPLAGPLRAVATSGSAERGEHIWTPAPGAASPYLQVSVFAADIVTADVLATAIVAGGEKTLNDSTGRWPIEVLAVLRDGELLATPGLRRPAS